MPEKDKYVKFKNYEKKTESLFMIYADFESTLVPEYYEKEIQKSLIQTNIKNKLFQLWLYMLISLVSLLKHT